MRRCLSDGSPNERAKLSKAAETYLEKLKSVVASHGYTLID